MDDVVGEEAEREGGREGGWREHDGGVYNASVNGWNGRAGDAADGRRRRRADAVGLRLRERDGWCEGAAAASASAGNNGAESDFISERIDRHH